MPQDLDGLKEALADRYAVERELGRGGMATVYLATDLKHHRPVALKVLKPELAAALGPDRFLREIEVTAGLHHPHILPLYDSGRIDGSADRRIEPGDASVDPSSRRSVDLLYYVMPYVEGESLRDRLERERQLPLEEALQLAREVAEALSYAHSRGLIHRDIKPENILLENGHALVADFGIAKAITTAGAERLTETGLSIGTPAYMSPEQAGGHDHIDARSDLYSLGCVLYEMLAGHPPFQGTTAHELLARHATDPVPPLRTGRTTIPEPIEAAVERVLAKVPADRYATAQQFSQALEIDATAYRRRQRALKTAGRLAIGVVGALVVAAAGYGTIRYRAATNWKRVALDPNAVAVLPFEVRTSDPALATLDEGIIDFLYPILSGDAGPRAIEPNPFLLALADRKARGQWGSADAPLRLAAHFRASQVLEGRVAQVGPRLTLNAWLRRVPDGVTVAQSTVSGPADSLYALIPQLAVALLGSHLGESAERIAALSGRPSVAVTAYLAGSRAERDGRRDDAVRYYGQALDADSTFALAGLRLLLVPQTASENSSTRRARRGLGAARAHANSLGMRERAALKLLAGLYDSAWTVVNTVAAARAWVEAAPDDPQAWRVYAYNGLGSAGPVIGPDWEQQTRNAIRWAWERDSTTAGSVEDLLSIATTLFPQDLALLRHLGRRYLEVADSSSDDWAGLAWATALASGDSSAVRAFRARAVSGDSKVLRWHNRTRVEQVEQAIGPRRDDSQLLARELRQTRLLSASDSANFAGSRIYTGIDEGKSEEVIDVLRGPLGPRWTGSRAFPWDLLIAYSLIHPGFEHAASEAAESLRVFISSRPDPGPLHLCHLDLYRAVHGDTVGLRSHVRELIPQFTDRVPLCPVLVEALVESRDRERPKTPALDSLESVLWKGWGQAAFPGQVAAALLTRMLRQRGEFARALAVTQLHEAGYGYFHYTQRCPLLKEEGELAALLGDTTRAIAAFRRYLEIRIDPDEGMREEREQVRAALDALVRAKG